MARVIGSDKDELYAYAEAVMQKSFNGMDNPKAPMAFRGGIGCFVLDRTGKFQAELVMLTPGCAVEEHNHPNVDTIDIPLAGYGEPSIGGKLARTVINLGVRIPAGVNHSGSTEHGVVWLSVQRWNNDAPDSVLHDWVVAVE